ncbi:hypothetical protein [Streptomyces sp. NPDC101776]|uniref:hypothetical protein n=1 Tax=Streptomyces sp. NPDC101776 TaxID=3366146 RepID=UPI0038135642
MLAVDETATHPYAVSFLSAGQTFTLVTLHVDYGKKAAGRVPELKVIAQWLAGWVEQEQVGPARLAAEVERL